MRTGRPTPPVVLTTEERETLEQWARRPTTAQALAQRARIVLACAADKTKGKIALGAGATRPAAGRWGRGAHVSRGSGSMDCSMNRVRARRERSATPRWNAWSG